MILMFEIDLLGKYCDLWWKYVFMMMYIIFYGKIFKYNFLVNIDCKLILLLFFFVFMKSN